MFQVPGIDVRSPPPVAHETPKKPMGKSPHQLVQTVFHQRIQETRCSTTSEPNVNLSDVSQQLAMDSLGVPFEHSNSVTVTVGVTSHS